MVKFHIVRFVSQSTTGLKIALIMLNVVMGKVTLFRQEVQNVMFKIFLGKHLIWQFYIVVAPRQHVGKND